MAGRPKERKGKGKSNFKLQTGFERVFGDV